jgi:hypothetical protein
MLADLKRRPLHPIPHATAAQLLAALFILVLFGAGCRAGQAPPPDRQLLSETDLSAQVHDDETVGQFTLSETAVVEISYTIPNIDTPYFDLTLHGPNGESMVILQSENYRTDENGGGSWEKSLPPGAYRLALTAAQSPGSLTIYLAHR